MNGKLLGFDIVKSRHVPSGQAYLVSGKLLVPENLDLSLVDGMMRAGMTASQAIDLVIRVQENQEALIAEDYSIAEMFE